MENHSRLKDWIVSHHRDIHLDLKKLSWPSKFDLSLYDYEAVIKIEGEYFIGRGTSESEEKAIIISVVESIERSVCFENVVLYSGAAAHPVKDIAKEKAIFESVERYYYFKSIEDGPAGDLQKNYLDFKKYTQTFEKRGVHFEFRNLSADDQLKGSICYASFKEKTFIGLGLKRSTKDSQNKALFECLTNLSHYMLTGEVEDNFHQKVKTSFDRRNIQCIPDEVSELRTQSSSFHIFPKAEILKNVPLFFFGASTNEFQNSDLNREIEASL